MQAVIADETAALAVDYPGWHIWRGRSGNGTETNWNATRKERPPAADGALRSLTAGGPAPLRSLLVQQEALERRAAAA